MADSSFAADVVTLLTARGVVTSASVFLGWLPGSPDNCVSVADESAPPSPHAMGGPEAPPVLEYLNVSIRVRHSSYASAWALSKQIHNILRNFQGEINGTTYVLVRERYSPVPLGRDENNRTTFSLNYTGMRRP